MSAKPISKIVIVGGGTAGWMEPSHISVLLGLGVIPTRHDPFADHVDLELLRSHFQRAGQTFSLGERRQ